jgi:hypothetical protein
MGSLEGASDIKAKPYFYTRLSTRMEERQLRQSTVWNWSLAAMILIVLINVISLLNISTETEENVDAIDLMASEYSMKNDDIYNSTLE